MGDFTTVGSRHGGDSRAGVPVLRAAYVGVEGVTVAVLRVRELGEVPAEGKWRPIFKWHLNKYILIHILIVLDLPTENVN